MLLRVMIQPHIQIQMNNLNGRLERGVLATVYNKIPANTRDTIFQNVAYQNMIFKLQALRMLWYKIRRKF